MLRWKKDQRDKCPRKFLYILLRFSEAKMQAILKFVLLSLCLKQSKVFFIEAVRHRHTNQKSNCD